MKNFTKLFALAVIILGFSATSFGQNTDNTAKAKGEIITALAVSHGAGADLDFGKIVPSTTAETNDFTVDGKTFSSINTTGNGSGTAVSGGSSASFTINGTIGTDYQVTLPGNGLVVVKNGSYEMPVKDFSCDVAESGTSVTGTTAIGKLVGASRTFYVGGTLTVGPATSNPVGQYTSDGFAVTIAFK